MRRDRENEASLKLSWTLTMIRFPKKAVADRNCHCTRDIRPSTGEGTTSTREIHIYSFCSFFGVSFTLGGFLEIYFVYACFKKTSIWVCLLSEIPPWNTVSIIWCGWGGGELWGVGTWRHENNWNPRNKRFSIFQLSNADFRVLCYNGIIIFKEKWNNLPEFFIRAHGMWSTLDEEINHNVYIWAGFECWRSQTNYGWQNKGSPSIVNRTFSSEGNSFLKHSSESSSTLNGQLCLTSALKLPRKYYFFHSFHVIVFRKAGEKAEGGGVKVKVRSSVKRLA